MKTLAQIAPQESTFDPQLLTLLEESGVEKDDFEDLDYFSLIPFFVLSGASVQTQAHAHGDHAHVTGVTVTLPEELEAHFFHVLPQMLAQLTGE